MAKRPKEKISRSFKQEFPEAVPLVEALGLRVQLQPGKRVNDMPTYWLEGTYQLTGYRTAKGGVPFTKEMAREHIQTVLKEIADGRAEIANESREQRFARVIAGMKTIEFQHRMFCEYRHPSGDSGTVFWYDGPRSASVHLHGESGAAAQVEYIPLAKMYEALSESFARGGTTIRKWPALKDA